MIKLLLEKLALILLGLGAGGVVASGIVAFITIIGIVPIMAYRTKTLHYMLWYENAVIIGSIAGSIFTFWQIPLPIGPIVTIFLFFAFGIFIGVFIIALAETLDVFPIFDRRIKVRKGITIIVISLALGKLVGSLCYWIYPYFTQVYLS